MEFEEGKMSGGCTTCEIMESDSVEIIWHRLDLSPKKKLYVNLSLKDISFDELLKEIIQAALV